MICPNCGLEIKSGAKFCSECGEKLTYHDNTQRNHIGKRIDLEESLKEAMHGDPRSLIDTANEIPQSIKDAMHGNPESLKDILVETQRLKYKVDYVDDNSKPLQKFLMVEIIIMIVMIIVGICVKNIATIMFSIFLILVAVLMLLGNKSKGNSFIKFKVGRNMVPMLIMMTVMVIGITIMTAAVGMTFWLD